MTIDITSLVAVFAVIWSAFQQFQINKICQSCPYYPANQSPRTLKAS
jgi:hypothetical protein